LQTLKTAHASHEKANLGLFGNLQPTAKSVADWLDHSAYITQISTEKQSSDAHCNFFTGDCSVGGGSWF